MNVGEMPAIALHEISFTTGSIALSDSKGRWTPPYAGEMPAIALHQISFTTGSIALIDFSGRWTPPKVTAGGICILG